MKPTPEQIDEVWNSDFGAMLFNLYTFRKDKRRKFLFSDRVQITKAMIAVMLEMEADLVANGRDVTPLLTRLLP